MNKGINKLLAVFFIIGIFCVPYFSLAESGISVYESDIEIQMWPENPEPYKDENIKLVSFATDLNKAIIEWRANGKLVLSGYGKSSYTLVAPGPDATILLEVTITPAESIDKITKTITITTSEVALLYESTDGYTPPFYKGKALVSRGGSIKIVAIPNTSKSGKSNISYTWKNGDNTDQDSSGYNKNTYILKNDDLNKSENITVMASSVDGSYNAIKNIEVPTYSPSMIFYRRSPTEGILYNKSLDENTLFPGDEMTIVAEPYFLKMDFGNINYAWKINGKQIDTPSKKTELTIRPTDRGGYATINMTIDNASELFQKVSGLLKLTL